MKSLFLHNLLQSAGKIPERDLTVPTSAVRANDRVVGVIEDLDLKRLYSLMGKYDEKLGLLHAQFDAKLRSVPFSQLAEAQAVRDEFEAKHNEVLSTGKLVSKLFWGSVRDQFGLWGKNVGLREGWKVVWLEERASPAPSSFLNGTGLATLLFLGGLGKD